MRLGAVVRKYVARALVMTAFLSLVLLLWSGISWSGVLPIRHVQVAGDFLRLAPLELEQNVKIVLEGGFFNVNVGEIKRRLLRQEWINHVVVRRVWPDRLVIHVTEHEPVARWRDNALLSKGLEIFYPAPLSFPPGLPALSGPGSSHAEVWERFQFINNGLARHDMEATVLILTERRAWQFRLQDGPLVMLGRKDVNARLERFFYYVLGHHAENLLQAISVDMRYPNGFAVKWPENSKTVIPG